MHIELLKSKIYKATVTEARIDYEGSITIDRELMSAAGICDYEKVLVANFRNGARFETYVIPGKIGSGTICINGAATHHAKAGDQVIIMAFCQLTGEEASTHIPRVIHVDEKNRMLERTLSQTS